MEQTQTWIRPQERVGVPDKSGSGVEHWILTSRCWGPRWDYESICGECVRLTSVSCESHLKGEWEVEWMGCWRVNVWVDSSFERHVRVQSPFGECGSVGVANVGTVHRCAHERAWGWDINVVWGVEGMVGDESWAWICFAVALWSISAAAAFHGHQHTRTPALVELMTLTLSQHYGIVISSSWSIMIIRWWSPFDNTPILFYNR